MLKTVTKTKKVHEVRGVSSLNWEVFTPLEGGVKISLGLGGVALKSLIDQPNDRLIFCDNIQ